MRELFLAVLTRAADRMQTEREEEEEQERDRQGVLVELER